MGPANSDAEPTVRGFSRGSRVFARYTLDRILGRGGMGVVWCAHDEVLREDVALKFLPDAVRWDPGAYEDLKAETRRARQLTHPNIVRIHDFVEDAGSAAISMELVSGSTLTALRLAKPNKVFEPDDIAAWLPQLCAALDYAHADARVVHRDLKPTNVMLASDGRLKVADFGVARSMADSISRVSMMSAGTLVYMSPQQAMGEEPSPADDIYALGATLYELLTGKPPFHTGDVRVQLYQRKPDSIAVRRRTLGIPAGEVPEAWEKVVSACLAKERDVRPRSARDVAAQLNAPARKSVVATMSRTFRFRSVARRGVLVAAVIAVGAFATWKLRPTATDSRSLETSHPSDAVRALAAWNFDGDARDGSGRGFDGATAQTVPAVDRYGRMDRALRFNGSAEVVVGDAPRLRWGGSAPFTAAFWVRQAGTTESGDSCFRSTGDAVGAFTWGLGFDRGRPMAQLGRVHTGEYGANISLTSSHTLSADTWHHLALVSDGAAATLFVDGEKSGSAPLGINRTAPAPKRVELRFGRPERLSVWAFTGDLDDARLWRRALSPTEVAALARRDPPPRFVLSKGTSFDTDDLLAALRNEFGPQAQLADWDNIKRFHTDDAQAWADELGLVIGALAGWVQRGGQRKFDEKRSYFLNRFDGTKPDYYQAHDEVGGMTVALGSWHSNRSPILAALPPIPPRRQTIAADATGVVRIKDELGRPPSAMALIWKLVPSQASGGGVTAEIRLGDNRRFVAACRAIGAGALGIALTDSTQPERSRQVSASNVELEFTLIARDGLLRFRAVSVVGGNLVFEERLAVHGFQSANIVAGELAGLVLAGGNAQPGLASATLIVE